MALGKVKTKQQELEQKIDHFKGKYKSLSGIGSGGNINTIQKLFCKGKKQKCILAICNLPSRS